MSKVEGMTERVLVNKDSQQLQAVLLSDITKSYDEVTGDLVNRSINMLNAVISLDTGEAVSASTGTVLLTTMSHIIDAQAVGGARASNLTDSNEAVLDEISSSMRNSTQQLVSKVLGASTPGQAPVILDSPNLKLALSRHNAKDLRDAVISNAAAVDDGRVRPMFSFPSGMLDAGDSDNPLQVDVTTMTWAMNPHSTNNGSRDLLATVTSVDFRRPSGEDMQLSGMTTTAFSFVMPMPTTAVSRSSLWF